MEKESKEPALGTEEEAHRTGMDRHACSLSLSPHQIWQNHMLLDRFFLQAVYLIAKIIFKKAWTFADSPMSAKTQEHYNAFSSSPDWIFAAVLRTPLYWWVSFWTDPFWKTRWMYCQMTGIPWTLTRCRQKMSASQPKSASLFTGASFLWSPLIANPSTGLPFFPNLWHQFHSKLIPSFRAFLGLLIIPPSPPITVSWLGPGRRGHQGGTQSLPAYLPHLHSFGLCLFLYRWQTQSAELSISWER